MKIMVLGDVHGNTAWCEKAIRRAMDGDPGSMVVFDTEMRNVCDANAPNQSGPLFQIDRST